jgi:hypothetical protein
LPEVSCLLDMFKLEDIDRTLPTVNGHRLRGRTLYEVVRSALKERREQKDLKSRTFPFDSDSFE